MKNFLFFLLLFTTSVNAQDTFFKAYNDIDNENRKIRQIVEHDNRFFTLSTGVCNSSSECSVLMEIDEYGNIIWEQKMTWLDVAANTMIISSDTIVIAGNHNPEQEEFYLHFRTMDGDSIKTYGVSDPMQPKTRMFVLGLQEFDDRYVLTGTGKDSMRSSLIYSVHKDGSLDTLLSVDRTNANSVAYGVSLDDQGFLNVIIDSDTQDEDDHKDFRKYDKEWDVIWEHSTEPISGSSQTNKVMVDLENRSIAYPNRVDFIGDVMYKVDRDGNELWSYDFDNVTGLVANISGLANAEDGGIFGMGRWSDSGLDDNFDIVLESVPFIFKLSSDGDLLWRKVIVTEDTTRYNRAIIGFFFDLEELDNGDLLAVGAWDYNPFRKMVVRLDRDGCVLGECGDYYTFTSVDDLLLKDNILIYPNPSLTEALRLQGLDSSMKYGYSIYSQEGLWISGGPCISNKEPISIGELSTGAYYLQIYDESHRIKTLMFLKE